MAKNTGNGYRRGGVISNLFETQRSAEFLRVKLQIK
jgi:hypothetical protein